MSPALLFNRHRLRRHLARASEDFLLREMCERLAERLSDINRQFPLMLDIGSFGRMREYLPEKSGVEKIISMNPVVGGDVIGDEECLPLAEGRFDLVMACGSLHWANDLPGALLQIQRILKPDGLFLAMLPGGRTLAELRQSFESAEMGLRGGVSPRVSPFVDIRDAGGLLQRAGFALPVVDGEMIEVSYEHPLKLLHDLRNMGQTNTLIASHKGFTPCSLMMQMADVYMREFSNAEGRITAGFEMLTLTAWKPHASQQQPAKRGSGKVNLSILDD